MRHLIKWQYRILIAVLLMAGTGCKKWVETNSPIDRPDASEIYKTDALATAVLTGMYNQMAAGSFASGSNSISIRAGLSADEFIGYSGSGAEAVSYYQNNVLATTTRFWAELYKYIYTCNSAIEGVTSSPTISMPVKRQLVGEAKFVRALANFYLVNLFGDIPLSLTTDFYANSVGTRIPRSDVANQIVQDLKDAQELLSDNYVSLDLKTPTSERVRPSKSAATALLARVYLFIGDNAGAEQQATIVLNNNTVYDTVSLNQVFLKNSKEAIWQLQPTAASFNTQDGKAFILTAAPSAAQPVSISQQLYGAFEAGDQRKASWIKAATFGGTTYYCPYKYQVQNGGILTEYSMVLRLGEMYLIRAEARAQLNKVTEAQQDLNVIRKRAKLPNSTASDKSGLLNAIEHERQVELFSEWGHRWLDLKRTNRVDLVMSMVAPSKGGGTWQSCKQLYPIPQVDIDKSMVLSQNPCY